MTDGAISPDGAAEMFSQAWYDRQEKILDEVTAQLFRKPTDDETQCAVIGFREGFQVNAAQLAAAEQRVAEVERLLHMGTDWMDPTHYAPGRCADPDGCWYCQVKAALAPEAAAGEG